MPYATLADLIERAGAREVLQIADRDSDDVADDDVISAALDDADNEINGYIGVKYPLPLTTTPVLCVTWAVSIARYWLHSDGAPEHVENDYKRAIGALKDVAHGRMVLPDITGLEPTTDAGHLSSAPPLVFTDAALRGWK